MPNRGRTTVTSSGRCMSLLQPSKPQHCAVSDPACRLRCRPTTLAPPNRLLRKLPAAEDLPPAARRQARNLPGLRPLGHARPPARTRRHLGAAYHRARYAGEADPDRTPAPVVHQVGVQTQGLPTVCYIYPISRTARLGRCPAYRGWTAAPGLALVIFAAFTGLCMVELVALRLRDVDLDARAARWHGASVRLVTGAARWIDILTIRAGRVSVVPTLDRT